jgi:hypothetical protein
LFSDQRSRPGNFANCDSSSKYSFETTGNSRISRTPEANASWSTALARPSVRR